MIPVNVHYRGSESERRQLAAVPVVGCYLYGPGDCRRLWVVDGVVVDGAAVAVYALEVSPRLVGELQTAWATWGEPIAAVDPAHPTERVARGRGA